MAQKVGTREIYSPVRPPSCALDGLTLSFTANYEMNQRRRDLINPADEFLFGGDTSKRVKEITELQKSRVCKGQGTPSTRELNRFVPYSRGCRRGRGRCTCTSTFTSLPG